MASSPTLPPDIIFEILTRASLETVGRCRIVSKEWNNTTYDSSFINLLCERTKTTSGFIIQSKKPHNCTYMSTFVDNNGVSNYELSLNFLPYPLSVKIEASHQGILVCVSGNYRNRPQYYVCKPTTKDWEQIPNPKTRYMTQATSLMVLTSKPLQYKIVRLSSPKSPYYYSKQLPSQEFYILRCEVFYSKTRAWKQLDNVALPLNEFVCFKHPVTTASGAFYWILCDKSSNQVFSFHVDEEIWEVFSLPCPDKSHNLTLVEYQGRLACIRKGEDLMELFVMEDYKNKVWSKRLNIKINELDRSSTSFQTLCNNNVALMTDPYRIIFYKFGNNSSKSLELNNLLPDGIFKLQSDSEPINLRGPLKSSTIKR